MFMFSLTFVTYASYTSHPKTVKEWGNGWTSPPPLRYIKPVNIIAMCFVRLRRVSVNTLVTSSVWWAAHRRFCYWFLIHDRTEPRVPKHHRLLFPVPHVGSFWGISVNNQALVRKRAVQFNIGTTFSVSRYLVSVRFYDQWMCVCVIEIYIYYTL